MLEAIVYMKYRGANRGVSAIELRKVGWNWALLCCDAPKTG